MNLKTQCVIVGGGPAGMMAGLLLARAGIDVVVLEKHADFLRDFRGDTLHPSTLQVMDDLGLLERLLERPHQKARTLGGFVGDTQTTIADFSALAVTAPYIALMPQWEFLDFLAQEAKTYPTFRLRMRAAVTDLLEDKGRVVGVVATTPEGPIRVHAPLVLGTDGRHSAVRASGKLSIRDLGAPIDVLWMRLSRKPSDPEQPLGRIDRGRVLVLIYRGDYWQCAYVIPKGSLATLDDSPIETLRARITEVAPFLADRVAELRSWDDVKLLTVRVDRLERWYRDGLLCIGDAAHAMSPIGGVGINLAIQDAVAAANRLAPVLRERAPTVTDLRRVQERREWPTRVTQAVQVFVQDRIINAVLTGGGGPLRAPLPVRLLARFPWLRRIPAYAVGMGVRPERPDASLR